MPRAFLCDFDGTVSPSDIGAAFVRAFSVGEERERERLLKRWVAGEIGHRQLTEAECELLRVSEAQAGAFARDFALDPHFPSFAERTRARGDAVVVVSEGFDFYIADLLARAGLADLPRAANRARFVDGRVVPEFPFAAGGCGACGNCKAVHVREWRGRGYHTVFIGDGLSDRCGARVADSVMARGQLLAWCRREGIEASAFESFSDVSRLSLGLRMQAGSA
jgi:HAD superfamily phosphoserine phosphatase-like hydrolase